MVDQGVIELPIIWLRAGAAENLPDDNRPFFELRWGRAPARPFPRSTWPIGHLDLVFYRTELHNMSAVANQSVLGLKLLFYSNDLRSAAVTMDVPETAQVSQESFLFDITEVLPDGLIKRANRIDDWAPVGSLSRSNLNLTTNSAQKVGGGLR